MNQQQTTLFLTELQHIAKYRSKLAPFDKMVIKQNVIFATDLESNYYSILPFNLTEKEFTFLYKKGENPLETEPLEQAYYPATFEPSQNTLEFEFDNERLKRALTFLGNTRSEIQTLKRGCLDFLCLVSDSGTLDGSTVTRVAIVTGSDRPVPQFDITQLF